MAYITLKIPIILFQICFACFTAVFCCLAVLLVYDYIKLPSANRYQELNVQTYLDEHAKLPLKFDTFNHKYLVYKLGRADAKLFALLDRDGNGLISFLEYESLVYAIKQTKAKTQKKTSQHLKSNDIITLKYDIGSIYPNASWHHFGKYCQGSLQNIHQNYLKNVSTKRKNFSISDFGIFLLPKKLGAIVSLIDSNSKLDYYLKNIERGRPGPYFYYGEQILHELLNPILPENVFIYPKNGAMLSYAMLRATNKDYDDIIFRSQFDIYHRSNQSSILLTPSGFNGRLVMSKKMLNVHYFNMWLENTVTGIDVHSQQGDCLGETHFTHINVSLSSKETKFDPDMVKYDAEIALDRAWKKLLITVYPFRAVDYYDFKTGFQIFSSESASKKKLHLVITFGSLVDQSCSEECSIFRDAVLSYPNIIQILNYRYLNVWASVSDIKKEFNKDSLLSKVKDKALKHLKADETFGVSIIVDQKGDIIRSFPINQFEFNKTRINENQDSAAEINESNEIVIEAYKKFISDSY